MTQAELDMQEESNKKAATEAGTISLAMSV